MQEKCIRENDNNIEVDKAQQFIKSNYKSIEKEADKLALLSNSVRLKIVLLLKNFNKLCVCDLSEILEVNQSAISQHLRKLKDGGILGKTREGLTIYYFIDETNNPDLIGLIEKIFLFKV
jgi:DNA-binding transcriptional ArsR family regulator